MSEGERQVLAIRLYDNWQGTDTSDSLEIYCYERGKEDGYNKAIDDFIHECDNHCGFYSGKNKSITREDILKIAEQLKERNNE